MGSGCVLPYLYVYLEDMEREAEELFQRLAGTATRVFLLGYESCAFIIDGN
jgi:hypothetical protein